VPKRLIVCGDALPRRSVDAKALRLSLTGKKPNVTLRIDDLTRAMIGNAQPSFLDLLEIAAYVYSADQACTRGGAGVDNLGADWRRHLSFRIPVRTLDLWRSDKVQSTLTTTLGFLSGDVYSFDFTEMKEVPPSQQYLFTREAVAHDKIEEVALFSGGLDSLSGAIREAVVDKRHVAFVTHEPSKKLAVRQRWLRKELTARAAHTPLFVPVTINKQKMLGREYTQRSRSFLFMALGATVAQMLGLSRLRFYENGVVSMNFPLSGQVVGTKATRTTHPQVLQGFAQILSLVANKRFDVDNPFLWLTKTEVVEAIAKAGCSDMIRSSTSCTHTWEMTNAHPHCGSCSQCIDRRFAILAAGTADFDPESQYKTELLTQARDDAEHRTMACAYVETASQVARMQPIDFFARFGEAGRVLRHLGERPDAAAVKVFDLYKRHARQVNTVIDRAIAAHAGALRERTLPSTCLLRLVCDSSLSVTPPEEAAPGQTAVPDNTFRKKATDAWQVRFAGGRDFILLRSKGAAYLHILLTHPECSFSAVKLASLVAQQPESYMLGNAGDGSDRTALSAYKAHYEELEEDLNEARANNDEAEQARIERERNELLALIRRDQGLGGRLRKDVDNSERVRKAVGNAITRVLADIQKEDPSLALHLKPPTLTRGRTLCYSPKTPVSWET
jgi:7-cyano-7-deazaguanine synthase in queuosine biosynthesis